MKILKSPDISIANVKFGYLYNWYAVNSGKLAPIGWHIETYAEYIARRTYLGGATVAGGKMKESGTTNWLTPNAGADNSSGFTALPGAYRDDFVNIYQYAMFWSSTERDSTTAYAYYLNYNYANFFDGFFGKTRGCSVRLIKNDSSDPGSVKVDGLIYSTVKIGTQVLTSENLMAKKYNDGTSIPEVTDWTDWSTRTIGARCSYSNNEANAGTVTVEKGKILKLGGKILRI